MKRNNEVALMIRERRQTRAFIGLTLLVGISLGASACSNEPSPRKVQLHRKVKLVQANQRPDQTPIRISIGAMITPKAGLSYYLALLKYLEPRVGKKIKVIDRNTYAETNALLEKGEIDLAFVCSRPYVEGRKKFGMKLLAVPVVEGKPVYYSYIIVRQESLARSLTDLRGKTFAFTDPSSNTGKLVPTSMLARLGETPASFFKKVLYSHAHDRSIRAVESGMVDGAAVDSLIWDFIVDAAAKPPATRVVRKSKPFGIPPVVYRPGLDPKLVTALQRWLLEMHEDPQGKKILTGMNIERFILGEDRNYDSIRAMLEEVQKGRTPAAETAAPGGEQQ